MWETSVKLCGPEHLEGHNYKIQKGKAVLETNVKSCGQKHPESEAIVGNTSRGQARPEPEWKTRGDDKS